MKNSYRKSSYSFFRISLVLAIIQTGLGNAYGQQGIQPLSVPDSIHNISPAFRNEYDFSNLQFSAKGNKDAYGNLFGDFTGYRFHFAKNLSIQAGNAPGFSSGSGGRYMQNRMLSDSSNGNLYSGYFPRGNFRLQGLRLDIQHFTLGASYNYGLNSLWRSGGDFSQGARNAALTLHAGLRF